MEAVGGGSATAATVGGGSETAAAVEGGRRRLRTAMAPPSARSSAAVGTSERVGGVESEGDGIYTGMGRDLHRNRTVGPTVSVKGAARQPLK